ncbi:MAG: hypothetical protein COZ37_07175 [bacterium (Candidatus Ratteibacteria) CG_4_10_14_3_um_filter_41_18]|uniref:Divergent polysaccharide deacetylase family protein n=4 Tax=Candidatus Ratteibacteria TaxID=2979319 RepID=A0A2M7YGK3_9BACT|nr:MAG: hypothetical protein COW28_07405 [bacterium (Candidatus Ratteibacteria) CG15_BIG_FIL_POST_REV_8_21_14_020_41_12]PIX76572.1 MAG: hypothetical protein COZ37_07175 [bacterium (Candidatus Ratteibacteria) CG_4_10_14_3_um_filter_41_18]PJA62109.1 MAG: hypothetical protein CO162_02795 [bacterium (Candidatus Ratteibacteria) CG_4_9_14_3_um_filter_41_21]
MKSYRKKKRRPRPRPTSWVPRFLVLLLSFFILCCSLFLIKSIPKKILPPKLAIIPIMPKIAIIIDDCGYDKKISEEIYKISSPITLAILPFLPYSSEIAQSASKAGYELMLHLPMEPLDSSHNPGEGAIWTKMSPKEIAHQTKVDIANLPPLIKGVNNHMGSRATADKRGMEVILQELKKHNLYYIDSVTSENSIGFAVAKELGIKTGKRDIFLDNEKNADYIKAQVEKLIKKALKNKNAIGIGHAHPLTIEVIKEMIPEIEKRGIKLVFASEIVQ